MNRLTTDKPEGNYENALNLFYGKDWEVWVRGGGSAPEYPDVRLIDYIRDIARRFDLAFTPEADDMTFAEETNDALLDGTDTLEGIVGTLHTAGWVCATLRGRLKEYEDTGLTPEICAEYKTFEDEAIGKGVSFARIIALMDADAAGMLFVLPAKPGDTVYWPIVDDVTGERYVSEDTISEVGTKGFWVSAVVGDEETFSDFTPWGQIGETVFFAREEAEAALGRAEHG